MRHHRLRPTLAAGIAFTLIATACSDDPDSTPPPPPVVTDQTDDTAVDRGAAALSDPVQLPALAGATATGPAVPVYTGAEVTPQSWVSSSLTPTLVVPGASGAWTFTLDDLSDGESGFGPLVYAEAGPEARVPLEAGLQQGRVYTWRAESPGSDPVGGSFTVDTQLSDAQQFDNAGAISVALSSGEAGFAWSSHTMAALGGSIGFALRFGGSNVPEVGVPVGWNLEAASSSPYVRLDISPDETVALVATNGITTNYEPAADGAYVPVQLSSDSLDTTGAAPVLTRNGDGTFAVTTKGGTTRFAIEEGTSSAYIVGTAATDKPSIGQSWSGGRLRSLSDPVSGREVTFRYGGETCPAPPRGFVAPPEGLLCAVQFWDGSTSSIHYVTAPNGTVTIGRLVDFPEAGIDGAVVTDVAYDAASRIARVRLPLIADLAAAGMVDPADAQFTTEVAYDDQGRVATVTEPASSPGGKRCQRSYAYVSERSTQVTDSCFGRQVASVVFDPTTFFTQELTNSFGEKATFTWDQATGQLQRFVDFSGMVTTYTYEGGQLTETRGPTKGSLNSAQVTLREYDQDTIAQGETVPMTGLDITYWPSATQATEGGVQELGPTSGGQLLNDLTVNWERSPANNDGGWSAIMTGGLQVDTAGVYQLRSNTGAATLRINNILCDAGGCDQLQLGAGLQQVRIDVSSTSPQAAMDITWAGPDTGGVELSVPTSRLHPQYGYATTTTVVDPTARNANQTSVSYSDYDNPADGRLTSRTTQSGARATIEYEAGVGGRGGWGRQSVAVQPGGNRFVYAYWGDREQAAPPCFGAKPVNQGGSAKSVAMPGADGGVGPAARQWVDAAGRVIASQFADGAVTCLTLDRAGNIVTIEQLGLGEDRRQETRRRVGGNPLVSELLDTVGTTTTVQRVETDMSGRTVRMVDRFGVETVTVYDDRTGEVASTATTIPGVGKVVGTNTYDEVGRFVSYAVDGRTMSTVTYNPDGTAKTITYGNGVTLANGYDQQNRLNSMSWTTASGAYSTTQTVSAGGHISGTSFTAGAATSVFDYAHDDAGRLSRASVTAGVAPEPREWAFTYDGNSNRLSQTITSAGAPVAVYGYAYDAADRLVSTDDPVAAGGIEYDGRGNVTRLGPTSFEYDAAQRLTGASDGTVTVAFQHSAAGTIMSRTIEGGSNPGTVQFGTAGLTFDAAGAPVAQAFSLPGGVSYTRWFGDTTPAAWDFASIGGDLFFSTDDAGAVQGSAQVYDPFGQVITTPEPARPGVKRLTWQSASGNEMFETATPFVLMGARVYVPALGRFLQVDPRVGGGLNSYDFAGQNPVNISDPMGESWTDWIGTIVAAAISIAASVMIPGAGFLVGAAIGIAVGAISYSIGWLVGRLSGSETPFSLAELGISIVATALFSGIAGRVKWTKAMKSLQYLRGQPANEPVKYYSRFQVARHAKDLNQTAKYLKWAEATQPAVGAQNAKAIQQGFKALDRLYHSNTMGRVKWVDKMWNVHAPYIKAGYPNLKLGPRAAHIPAFDPSAPARASSIVSSTSSVSDYATIRSFVGQ